MKVYPYKVAVFQNHASPRTWCKARKSRAMRVYACVSGRGRGRERAGGEEGAPDIGSSGKGWGKGALALGIAARYE